MVDQYPSSELCYYSKSISCNQLLDGHMPRTKCALHSYMAETDYLPTMPLQTCKFLSGNTERDLYQINTV